MYGLWTIWRRCGLFHRIKNYRISWDSIPVGVWPVIITIPFSLLGCICVYFYVIGTIAIMKHINSHTPQSPPSCTYCVVNNALKSARGHAPLTAGNGAAMENGNTTFWTVNCGKIKVTFVGLQTSQMVLDSPLNLLPRVSTTWRNTTVMQKPESRYLQITCNKLWIESWKCLQLRIQNFSESTLIHSWPSKGNLYVQYKI